MAYVIEVYPHGESNNVYKLYTRELGLIYAHAQSVRELKSRNRYALQVGHLITVTLVRGREVWRVTSAQTVPEHEMEGDAPVPRKLLWLIGKLVAVEDQSEEVFDHLVAGERAISTNYEKDHALIEAVTLLRVMNVLGFVARPLEEEQIAYFLENNGYSEEHMFLARKYSELLFIRVNSALEEAK